VLRTPILPVATASTTDLETEAVDRIVKLCSEYEPFEFSGGGCPCLRRGILEIVRDLVGKAGERAIYEVESTDEGEPS
jgi:hypothetical protein